MTDRKSICKVNACAWDTVVVKREEILSHEVAEQTILVSIDKNLADMQHAFSLDGVAGFIWDLLDGKRSLEQICGQIKTRFNVGKEQAEEELQLFIDELKKEEFITVKHG